jgi:hypothetical protein
VRWDYSAPDWIGGRWSFEIFLALDRGQFELENGAVFISFAP